MTVVNTQAHEAWNGADGAHWTEHADRYDATTKPHWERVLATGCFTATSDVLDVGCGTGFTTRDLARKATQGRALGVDISAVMVELARSRAVDEGLTNVEFEYGDAEVHPFAPAGHTVALSFFGGMFFSDPVAAYRNVGDGLRSGSPLVLMGFRDLQRNEWLNNFRAALAVGRDLPTPPPHAPSPFSFADADHTRDVLTAAGFADVAFESVDLPMRFGRDADDAWEFVSSLGIVTWLAHDLDEDDRRRALEALRADVIAHDGPNGVEYDSSAWLITARKA